MSNAVYPTIKGLKIDVLKTPTFNTIIQTGANEYETRIRQTVNPIYKWTLIYEWLYDQFPSANNTQPFAPYTDYQTFLGFFLARAGQYDSFLFPDPTDLNGGLVCYFGPAITVLAATTPPTLPNSPAAASGTPNTAGTQTYRPAQLQLLNDGAGNYYSPLQLNWGGLFQDDITDVVSTPIVYANGTKMATPYNYTLAGPGLALPGASFMGKYIAWTNVATPTAPITAQFQYYYRVRFATDDQDFEQFLSQMWTIGGQEAKNGKGTLELRSARF
jgi:hypothetical protein